MNIPCSSNAKQHNGFTLVEVIVVIILVGILAATASSKFTGSDTFEAHTFQNSLVSALRLTQQRAMQQTKTSDGYCHQIVFDTTTNKRYGVPDRSNCGVTVFPNPFTPDATGLDLTTSTYNVTFRLVTTGGGGNIVSFNSMGQPQSSCAGGCLINVSSSVETVQVKIESEGYIHAL
ncbi:MAG: prepilin-type N-terminal cleavage/methylation domain-containing protein [Alteromonadaceae bacterium]|nr:prepilin-type N-terminal cleavage/methylation domain-containing protein [Alteromonadaceae bacterium]